MNKVLLTGLGIGKELDVCQSCNMNFESIMTNPEVLLWADKICLPQNLPYLGGDPAKEKEERAINLMLSILESENLIEHIDIHNMYVSLLSMFLLQEVLLFRGAQH